MIDCSPSDSTLCWQSYDIRENKVTFVNVKTKYQIDEDLVLDYTLQEEFRSSTRDWVGIFPRNWSNLQQYLTFEYCPSAHPSTANPLNRKIMFPRIFHRETPLNLEYQFVYVSKEIRITATSTYFRFANLLSDNAVKRCSCMTNICTNSEVFSNTTIDKTEAKRQPPIGGLRPTCRYCHRKICGLKIDALRGNFLAKLSDSLLNRVHRLEGDLSFAESALKNAKGVRENLAKRLQAYEAFVAEMLKALAVRGTVKITDEQGTEIVLQRVNENYRSAEVDASQSSALKDEIVALKRLLEEQQQTIATLTERRNPDIPQRDRINCVDREIQTDSDYFIKSTQRPIDRRNSKETPIECKEKNASIVKPKRAKLPLDVRAKAQEIESIDTSKIFLKSNEEDKSCSKTEQQALKIPKPSGILVQSKDVKFAIVRYSQSDKVKRP